jgi:hypothetical protein
MFSFENDPDIETLSNASEFLGDTFNIWDNDSDLVYWDNDSDLVNFI